jgi:hypothetical protein
MAVKFTNIFQIQIPKNLTKSFFWYTNIPFGKLGFKPFVLEASRAYTKHNNFQREGLESR